MPFIPDTPNVRRGFFPELREQLECLREFLDTWAKNQHQLMCRQEVQLEEMITKALRSSEECDPNRSHQWRAVDCDNRAPSVEGQHFCELHCCPGPERSPHHANCVSESRAAVDNDLLRSSSLDLECSQCGRILQPDTCHVAPYLYSDDPVKQTSTVRFCPDLSDVSAPSPAQQGSNRHSHRSLQSQPESPQEHGSNAWHSRRISAASTMSRSTIASGTSGHIRFRPSRWYRGANSSTSLSTLASARGANSITSRSTLASACSDRQRKDTTKFDIAAQVASSALAYDSKAVPPDDKPPPSWRHLSFDDTRRLQAAEDVTTFLRVHGSQASSDIEDKAAVMEAALSNMSKSDRVRLKFQSLCVGSVDPDKSCLVNFLNHPFCQFICALVVLVNSALVGIAVEVEAHDSDDEYKILLENLSWACSGFFMLELGVRTMAFGLKEFFLYADDRYMNTFDALLVLLSVVDAVMSVQRTDLDFDMGKVFKILRLLRILRIFRIFRFFHELSLMVMMIGECLASLCWAIVLLLIIMYTFAVVLTQSAVSYKKRQEYESLDELASSERLFGTMPRTFYCLFQSILGGLSWGEATDVMLKVDEFGAMLFICYILFTILAVLNIINGIFVDNALAASKTQRDYIVRQEEKMRAIVLKELGMLFEDMDEDGSGTITWEEMECALENKETTHFLRALGLHIDDMKLLFEMIDNQGEGVLHLQEFLEGCQRCTGNSTNIDLKIILHEVRRLHQHIEHKLAHLPVVGTSPVVSTNATVPVTVENVEALHDSFRIRSRATSDVEADFQLPVERYLRPPQATPQLWKDSALLSGLSDKPHRSTKPDSLDDLAPPTGLSTG